VGVVPDSLPLMTTDEEVVDRITKLYHSLQPEVTGKGSALAY
jgi:hypothetical protein